MPSVAIKLYSVFFKFLFKLRLQALEERKAAAGHDHPFGVAGRPDESVAAANPAFAADGVATKDIHIDPFTSLTVRIFLPDSCLVGGGKVAGSRPADPARRSSIGTGASPAAKVVPLADAGRRRSNYGGGGYQGYAPAAAGGARKLPVVLQFHGGGFVSGSSDSAANDLFCRRIAKLCDVVVVAVGYRLAPENRYPAAFEDGMKVLNWLGKQAKLAECRGADHLRKGEVRRHIVDGFGASMVEPWLAAHGDPSRFVRYTSPLYVCLLCEVLYYCYESFCVILVNCLFMVMLKLGHI